MTNKEKCQQANVIPLVIEPLDSILGPRSLTREAEEILNDSYTIKDIIHPGAEDLLTTVAIEDNSRTNGAINTQISIDEHQKFWKIAKESTQSSMSGLHFGFYKTTSRLVHLAHLATQFINIQFRTGFSSWWSKGDLNITLQKKEGCFDPKKQRSIHLLEADSLKDAKLFSAVE